MLKNGWYIYAYIFIYHTSVYANFVKDDMQKHSCTKFVDLLHVSTNFCIGFESFRPVTEKIICGKQ